METNELREDIVELKTAVASLVMEMKSAWKRIDEQTRLTESVHALAMSVQGLTAEMKQMRIEQDAARRDIDMLKDKPAKRWDTVIASLLSALVGAIVAWFISAK